MRHRTFRGLALPAAPPALEKRVLRAVGEAGPAPRWAWIDRLWWSRSLRLGWLAAVLVLVALHAAVPGPRLETSAPSIDPFSPRSTPSMSAAEVAARVGLLLEGER